MFQVDFNAEKYNEKTEAFRALREQASALRRSRATTKKITSWDPATRAGASTHREKTVTLGRNIGSVAHYFDNKCSSALDVICKDEFTIHYQVYGDIDREATYGCNTLSIFYPVRWLQCCVSVTLYPDNLDRVLAREKFATAAREGIPNRDDIAKVTGWSRDAVRGIPDIDVSLFKTLVEQVTVGQSKLTRLVKGFLMLLECMERDHIDVTLDVQNTVIYNPAQVINSFRQGDRAYVYNSKPTSAVHTAVLWRMCGVYPPPELGGSHITIPADGPNVFMVLEGAIPPQGRVVRLTPSLIYASLMAYAMDVSSTGHLQQALVIACSLQQNRYFSRVKLPKVVSTVDLMVPAFITVSTRLDKPILTREMSTSIGRLHQMLLFMNVKDILTSAELTTANGFNPLPSMRAFMGSQAALMTQMSSELSPLCLAEATVKMKIHEVMREDDFSDILNISAFEGLWVCQEATKCIKNGILSALIHGVNDLSGDICSYDIVRREMDLGNIVYNPMEMPKGAFTVGWVCVSPTGRRQERPPKKRISRQVDLVHPCGTKPGSTLRNHVRERFERRRATPPEGNWIPSTPPPIDFKLQLRKPKHRKPSAGFSDPPDYEATSNKSESGSSSGRVIIEDSEDSPQIERDVPSSPLALTKIAYQAAKKLGNNIIGLPPGGQEFIDKVGDTTGQLTSSEQLDQLLRSSNLRLAGKESSSLLLVLNNIGAQGIVKHSKDIDTMMDTIERRQMLFNYSGPVMLGNSNLAKRLNNLIDRGSRTNTTGSKLREMRDKKRHWDGDITTAPLQGLRYVVNSQAWLGFLESEGINGQDNVDGRRLYQLLGEVMSRLDGSFTPVDTEMVAHWIIGTSANHFPSTITRQELVDIGRPELLPYRHAPSSFGPRAVRQEDSKYLILAAAVPRKLFDFDVLSSLCGHFSLSRATIERLRDTYGLFMKQ